MHYVPAQEQQHQALRRALHRKATDRTLVLLREEEPARLVLLHPPREVRAVAVEDGLAALEERDLQVEVVQDLDERFLEPGNLEAVLDTPNETDGVDFWADVLKKTADEC